MKDDSKKPNSHASLGVVSHSTDYENISKLLSEIEANESFQFDGKLNQIVKAWNFIADAGYWAVISLRTTENQKEAPEPYRKWVEKISKEDSFAGYMLRTYPLKNGQFEITETDLEGLNKLIGIYFGYR